MKRYTYLSKKLSNNTITDSEKAELFALAFGEDYMRSTDKGSRKQYSE